MVGAMHTRNAGSARGAATAAQLWRANQCGLIELRDEPAEPLERTVMKEVLAEAARLGLWQPVRGVRQEVRSGL